MCYINNITTRIYRHMNITLRKANALQQAVNEAIKKLELTTEVGINEFQKPAEVIATANEKFTTNLTRRNMLVNALYEIRLEVARSNASSGINDTLAMLARTEKQIGFYSRLTSLVPQVDMEIVRGKIRKIKSREPSDSRYSRGLFDNDEEVSTGIFSQDELDSFRITLNDFKRAKLKMQDELLEMNVRNDISLSVEATNTLAAEEIL
jgi:hypothetical protein